MRDLRARIEARAGAAAVVLREPVLDGLIAYLEVLALWNRRINLTAFDLSAPSDEAIDRLLVEPVAAAALLRASDRRALDVGSGGGSPALPLALAASFSEAVLVESRSKKAAFLREAIRTLGVAARVEVVRVEELAVPAAGPFDVVSLRAVRADAGVWGAVYRLLAPAGRVLWFGGIGQTIENGFVRAGSLGSTAVLDRAAAERD